MSDEKIRFKKYTVEVDDEKKEIRGIGGSPFGAFNLQRSYLLKQAGYKFFDEDGNEVTDKCWSPSRMILDCDLKLEEDEEG